MRRRLVAALLAAVFALPVSLAAVSVVRAQTNQTEVSGGVNAGNGLKVSPVRYDLTVEPGKSQTIDITVENITSQPAELRAIVNDFVAAEDESGRPRILFDENDNAPGHGLRRYVAPISDFKLSPKEQKVVKVTVTMPKDAAGGGYYGAVRFMPTSTKGDKNVALSASVGSLVLVTVPGDVKEQVAIEGLNVNRGEGKASTVFFNGDSIKANLRFKNSGNVQLAPFGKMLLKKGGKEIASYEINSTSPRGVVLPDSIRRFEVGFGDKARSLGKYTIEGNFGYGSRGQLLTASTTFYVVPMPIAIAAAVVIALVVLAAFMLPKMLKEHDRRLIRKMRR